MQDDNLLTLHCPECKQLAEVIVDNDNLICLECGFHFDEKTAARYLNNGPAASSSNEPNAPSESKSLA